MKSLAKYKWTQNRGLYIAGTLLLLCITATLTWMARPPDSPQSGNAALPEIVSYNYHIRPILSDRCFACHGPDANHREAGLRLDSPDDAYRLLKDTPSVHGIVPGKPELSGVYQRIISGDESLKMPPASSNLSLTPYEIKLIEKWIKQGATYEKHWAFLPPKKAKLPEVPTRDWPLNEIDYFIASSMAQRGLSPNEEADPETLFRRLHLDLVGLPPTPEELQEFLTNRSTTATDEVVDRLLSSPHYGEKMALHWLDVARYADSYGYQDDQWRTQWPWRDWVIHAFNKNLPYSDFLTWQIAGDMLPNPTKEQILATAFGRNHKITEEQGAIDEEYRVTYVLDRTNTYAKGVLGITMECAQCHDHKYDPFSQTNYYELFAFFNNTPEKGLEITNSRESLPRKHPFMEISAEDRAGLLSFVRHADTSLLEVSVMRDLAQPRQTFVLDRGLYDSPTHKVSPSTPPAIFPFDTLKYARNRLGLAQWTISEDNPLTARVFVNQIWEKFFGRGLVETLADFGSQGSLPSHPELLDWLSADFMENGWDVKRLIRQIVGSATYRQSSRVSSKKLEADPENIYLSRAPRIRMQAELIRDYVMATSGLLTEKIGGPSFKPYQPKGIWEVTSSGRGNLKRYVQDHGEDLYRRGIYSFIKLTVPPPNMLIFDASNRDQCEVRRIRTNTPLQALVMLNDPTILEASRVLAGELLTTIDGTETELIQIAFRRILCRKPESEELTLLTEFYRKEKARYASTPQDAKSALTVGEFSRRDHVSPVDHAALMSVVHTLYNLEETITKN
jgi:hypothetical protein